LICEQANEAILRYTNYDRHEGGQTIY
jgi:hypothetical protein